MSAATPDLLPLWEVKKMVRERGGVFSAAEYGCDGLVLVLSFWTEVEAGNFARLLDDRMGKSRADDARVLGWTCERRVAAGTTYVEARVVVDPARIA